VGTGEDRVLKRGLAPRWVIGLVRRLTSSSCAYKSRAAHDGRATAIGEALRSIAPGQRTDRLMKTPLQTVGFHDGAGGGLRILRVRFALRDYQ
jgi:hypothetical protein